MSKNTSLGYAEGPAAATENLPERSARFSGLGYNHRWNSIGADGDVCGEQPSSKSDTLRTGWDYEAMRD